MIAETIMSFSFQTLISCSHSKVALMQEMVALVIVQSSAEFIPDFSVLCLTRKAMAVSALHQFLIWNFTAIFRNEIKAEKKLLLKIRSTGV